VATLGVFDGVHLGHQAVLREVIAGARREGGTSLVLTFDPHPVEVLKGKPLPFISSLEHRLLFFESLGLDASLVIRFDRNQAKLSAEEFIENLLVRRIGIIGLVLGFNCRFGRDALGDFALARKISEKYGFWCREVPPVVVDGEVVSSTTLREKILSGRLEEAARMLGRPVSVLGTVREGTGRGRRLGFATANLDLHHEARPPAGVYITKALLRGKAYASVTNIGRCPTFEVLRKGAGTGEELVEVHILDFEGDIYGEILEVQFLLFLRPEITFPDPEALKRRLRVDVEQAKKYFLGLNR